MKTTVVPAQITTVEDRIAGSLTLPQIVLLVMSMVIGALIYAVVMPKMHFGSIKMTLIIIEFIFFGGLALRFNGKIVGEWLVIYLRFSSRPRRYIFTKNDPIHREIILEEPKATELKKSEIKAESKAAKTISLRDQIKIDQLFNEDQIRLSFKPSKKGGLNVELQKAEN
jgi:hypothetical protein